MRSLCIFAILAAFATAAFAVPPTPAVLWQFQGIEDINAFATLPDVDGDGVADIVIESYDAGASGGDHLSLVSGGGTTPPAVIWSVTPHSGVSDGGGDGDFCLTTCSDLNDDGFPDVLLGTAWGNRSVHAIDGMTGAVLWTFDTYNEPYSGWVYSVAAVPDRNGDGKPEVAFGCGSDNNRGYMVSGADGSLMWRFIGSSDAIYGTVVVPDVNGDGAADVVFCGGDFEHRVFCVSGGSNGAATQIWAYDTGASNWTVAVIDDINSDGHPEVLAGSWQATEQVACLDGATGVPLWHYTVGAYEYVMRLVPIDDVDGDGYRDVAVGSWSRGLPVISGLTGALIWQSYAGATNGGDFWAADTVADVDGDGLAEVIGGSFDTNVYLFSGAAGDTLWTFTTGNRLFSVRGTVDLSGNLAPDVLAGCQYLNGGGRAYALEGGTGVTPVPDLPAADGQAGWLDPSRVELRWHCAEPLPCVVDRITDDADKARAERLALIQAFEQHELTMREVVAAVRGGAKSADGVRLTAEPVVPSGQAGGAWVYRLVDAGATAGTIYRISIVRPDGSESTVLSLAPRGDATPQPLLRAVTVSPNPFNPRTEVRVSLDRPATVTVAIHDARGRLVAALRPRACPAGDSALRWQGQGLDGRDLPAGMYLMRVEAGGASRTVKAVLVR